ncbi:MAG: thioredoxin domain-containing protein [Methanosarcinaceae archaeon]
MHNNWMNKRIFSIGCELSKGKSMRKSITLTILIGTVLVLSGCVGQDNGETSFDNLATHVTDIRQINETLLDGPVLLKIGAEWCQPCLDQAPIISALAEEYNGRAAVMYIDTDKSPDISNFFNVYSIPDSFVIIGIENGQYIYMARDGTTSTKREYARFIGLTDKQTLANTLDYAIELNK